MSKTLQIQATEPQQAFHQLECKYPLFVGGFGSGKTETMVNQGFLDALQSPNALIGMYEPTYDLVRLILAPRLLEKLTEHGIEFTYNKAENIVHTHHPQIGNFILRTLDNPERIVGYETFRAHVDEIDTLKEHKAADAWNKIIARNRQKPLGLKDPFNRVAAYTTPEGFRFVYNRWVTNTNEHYDLVKASTHSNPFLPDDYVEALRATYPAELIDAYINGEFVNLTSGTVYRAYNRKLNSSTQKVTDSETLYIGMDFNVDNMAATIYVKRDEKCKQKVANMPKSASTNVTVWHAVDEIHDAYDTKSVAILIREKYPKNRVIVYPDSSGKNRSTNAGAADSDIATLQTAPFKFECRYRSTNPRVKDRIMAMNAALEKGLVKINADACKRTVECLEQQAYDKNGQPDKSSGVDHQNDATTYPIAYEMSIRKPVATLPVQWYK